MGPVAGPHTQQLRFWRRLIWLAASLHGIATLALALTRFHTDKAALLDMGFYDQAIWTAFTEGTPMISMYPPNDARHFFTLHFVPLVLLLAPVYRWLPVESLMVVQSVLVSASAVILFHAVVQMKVQPRAAFVWMLVYLLNPFLWSGTVWDFRERSIALPLMATAFLALAAKRPALFAAAAAGLALCQEHFGVAIFGFGLLWAYQNGRDRVGIPIAAGGLLVLAAVALVMTGLRPVGESTPLVGGSMHAARYSWLMRPSEWLPALRELVPQGVAYLLFYLAVPFAGLSLFSPAFLLPGLADLAANLLSLNPMPRSVYAYHSMTLVPVFLVSAVRTSLRWSNPDKWARVALVATLPFTYATFPAALPGAANIWKIDSIVLNRDPAVSEIERRLIPSMSVAVQSGIGGFFSRRTSVYIFPARMDEVDAVVLKLEYPYADLQYAPFSIPYTIDRDHGVDEMADDVLPATQRLLENRSYGVVYWERNWLVAVRGAEDRVDRRLVQDRVTELRRAFSARQEPVASTGR